MRERLVFAEPLGSGAHRERSERGDAARFAETEKASVFEPCRRSLDDTPKEEDTRRKKIAQTIVREQQRQYDWLDRHDRKREIVSERDTP